MDRISPRTRPGRPRLLLLAAALGAVVLVAAGCSSGSVGARSATAAGEVAAGPASTGNAQQALDRASGGGDVVQHRAVISTGHVVLSSGDVAATRVRVDAVLTREGGSVADEHTATDRRGTVTSTHLVLRVPSARFADTMSALAGLATLRSASSQTQDVTLQVIDLGARIRSERAGVRRLRHLVGHTASLRALLDVERALTERQGVLESLKQQRAYLADQTTKATITLDVSRRTAPPAAARGGFVGGLSHGWNALVAVVVGLLVVTGAALPFVVLAALVGVPAWLVVRRQRRRQREVPVES